MARPVVALIGRPNVGKSTLFNRLIGERLAVVHDTPGTTRDRIYGTAEWRGREFTLVDTGGIGLELGAFEQDVLAQAEEAVREADVVVLVVDASAGILPADEDVARLLRRSHRPLLVAANKAEGPRARLAVPEFHALGLGDPIAVSAIQGTGTGDLLDAILQRLPAEEERPEEPVAVALAIVGRPNVGKSSLLNAVLGRSRAIVSEVPGTTRDVVDTLINYRGKRVLLIDTAGIRRRGRIEPGVEKYSVLRAVSAIERADVAVVVMDATEGVTEQDAHIAGYVHEAAKGMILAMNKWDLVPSERRRPHEWEAAVRRELAFASYAPVVFISAKTGLRVERVLDLADAIQTEREKRVPTATLNQVIHQEVAAHPLTERGRKLRVYYVTQPEVRPPTFVFFVNDPTILHFSYVRFLENRIREHFGFQGTGIRLKFKARSER